MTEPKSKIKGGCCGPTKPVCNYDGPGALIPVGFTGNMFEGLRYQVTPQCKGALGNAYGMTRKEFIDWTESQGKAIDPVEVLKKRLKAAGLYEFACSEAME